MNAKKTEVEHYEEMVRTRAKFHQVWHAYLSRRVDSLAKAPASAIAYEIAWHAFKAGKESARVR